MTPTMISAAETRFIAQMGAEYPSLPLVFSNMAAPDDGDYATLHVVAGETFPSAIGMPADSRNVGVVHINVYTDPEQGAGAGSAMAYFAGRIFRRYSAAVGTEGYIVYKDPQVLDMGEVRGRNMQAVRVPYRYDFQG